MASESPISTLKVLAFLAVVISPAFCVNINITSPFITNWGDWGRMARCPFGTRYAHGFQLITNGAGSRDDTALNSIRLFCGDPHRPETPVITSSQGDFGNWGTVYTCYPGVLNGFQLRSEPDQGSGDDTAANNIRFFCSNLSNPNDYIQGDGMTWGDWSTSQHCYGGQAICAIQTQIEPYQGSGGDDTMLNNVRFECCDMRQSVHETSEAGPQEKITTVEDLKIWASDEEVKVEAVVNPKLALPILAVAQKK